jgi:hypothetical protein
LVTDTAGIPSFVGIDQISTGGLPAGFLAAKLVYKCLEYLQEEENLCRSVIFSAATQESLPQPK